MLGILLFAVFALPISSTSYFANVSTRAGRRGSVDLCRTADCRPRRGFGCTVPDRMTYDFVAYQNDGVARS
jgi:hypothetical protein